MIELRSVHAAVGSFRLAEIDIAIGAGTCHVIVGPTGAGKTFLLETIIGLRQPVAGNILIDGRDVAAIPPHGRQISYVPQDTCLFPTMTVRQNIRFGLEARRTANGASDEAFIARLIEFLHIGDILDRFPRNLSGGERQRVALARALATKPVLLILDEPFSAIDHSLREEIRRMIKELLDEFKTTTLIVTHDLDEAFFLGDIVSIILGGRIIQSGPREEMYYHPKSMAAAEFLGIKNIFPGVVETLTKNEITISSVDLGRKLTVPCRCAHKRFTPQQPVRFGIRSEAVHILRQPANPESGQGVFDARIKRIFVRGILHTIIAEPSTPRKVAVEIDVHDAAVRKLGLREGADIQIKLRPEHIFLLAVTG